MTLKFEIVVTDIFRLRDGRTVCVGPVEGGEDLIEPQACDLLVKGVKKATIRIAEDLVEGKHPEGLRAVSTSDTVELDPQSLSKSECRLRSAGDGE